MKEEMKEDNICQSQQHPAYLSGALPKRLKPEPEKPCRLELQKNLSYFKKIFNFKNNFKKTNV